MSTTKKKQIEIGDVVTFLGGRQGRVRGTVTKLWTKYPRRRRSLGIPYAEVNDEKNDGFWKVPVRDLTVVGKGDAKQATERVDEIKSNRKAQEMDRRAKNFDVSQERGFFTLEIGDPIEVKFQNVGWKLTSFQGFVKGSGNVRFRVMGKTQTCSPEIVRKVGSDVK